jgi:hypothetical protein
MQVICSPRHPAADVVLGRFVPESEHDPEHCARCLIAAGLAVDVTADYYDHRTGRLVA